MIRTPRPYQVEGIEYLTTPNVTVRQLATSSNSQVTNVGTVVGCRHLLTDAPGAGKTEQAERAANILMQRWDVEHDVQSQEQQAATCVIAPAHLTKQWYDDLCEQYPNDSIVYFEGTRQTKERDAQNKARWYIISTQSFRHEHFYKLMLKVYAQHRVQVTIIDESHYVKGRDTVTARNIRTLTRPAYCPHVILLSATPVIREADDLFMQLSIINPYHFSNFMDYLNEYCYFDYTSWGCSNVSLRKSAYTALLPYMMGRTYAQIGLQLPPLISPPPVLNDIIKERRKAYDDVKTFWYHLVDSADPDTAKLTANSAMEVMHLLRRLISSPEKFQSLTNFINDDQGPYLIGCVYRDTAHMLAKHIESTCPELHTITITGEIEPVERIRRAKDSHDTHDVIIATIPSISEGCDLSHCSTVYFVEEDFTPGKMYQFLSRVRRHRNARGIEGGGPGAVTITTDNHLEIELAPNEKPVLVRYFHVQKTIDQHIHAVQHNRAVNVKDLIKVELAS